MAEPFGRIRVRGEWPYLRIDATSVTVRDAGRIVSVAGRSSRLDAMAVPRNHHSVAVPMTAGGGRCADGDGADHPDLRIVTPPDLIVSGP